MAFDLYQTITDRIIAELQNGVIPWHKPWVCGTSGAISYETGKPYSLLNQMILGKPGEYLTFAQVQKQGGRIKKGEKSSMIVFWKWIEKPSAEDPEQIEHIPFLQYFNVFHIDQTEGVKPRHTQPLPEGASPDQTADTIIADYITRSGVTMKHETSDRAYYQPSTDSVTLPLLDQFRNTAEYYSTAFHELTHSTGHASRLNRISRAAFFGSSEYSREELTAEIGAAALVNHCGLETPGSFRNTAAYVQSWLKVLQDDKRFIVSAAGAAEKAVSLILG